LSVAVSPVDDGSRRLAEKLPWFAVAAAGLAADLWTKHLVFYPDVLRPGFDERRLQIVGRVLGLSWWQTILAYNNGVTFGLGSSLGAWALSLGTGLVIVLLSRALWQAPRTERLKCFALSIIVGGAVGNLYDRALRPFVEADTHPGVRDFIDWYFPDGSAAAEFLRSHNVSNHWYTFNVADALIVSGVVLLAWKILREKPREAPAPGRAAA
jgi:signal peptidase II